MKEKDKFDRLNSETVYLLHDWEEIVIKPIPGGGYFARQSGGVEYKVHHSTNLVAESIMMWNEITEEEYNAYLPQKDPAHNGRTSTLKRKLGRFSVILLSSSVRDFYLNQIVYIHEPTSNRNSAIAIHINILSLLSALFDLSSV